MVAFPDHGKKTARRERSQAARPSALLRLVRGFCGVGFCMAAFGLWLVPSLDPAAQLVKLCASMVLLGGGAYLLHVRKEPAEPAAEAEPVRGKLRVREYDVRGRPVLRKR